MKVKINFGKSSKVIPIHRIEFSFEIELVESCLIRERERERKVIRSFLLNSSSVFQWCNYRVTGQFVHWFKQKRLDSYSKDVYSFVPVERYA